MQFIVFMRRNVFIALLIILMFPCYSAEPPESIRIATLYYNSPLEQYIKSANTSLGFKIDIIGSLCTEMKKNCDLLPLRFDKLLTALNNKDIDVMVLGIGLMPSPADNYIFSYQILECSENK